MTRVVSPLKHVALPRYELPMFLTPALRGLLAAQDEAFTALRAEHQAFRAKHDAEQDSFERRRRASQSTAAPIRADEAPEYPDDYRFSWQLEQLWDQTLEAICAIGRDRLEGAAIKDLKTELAGFESSGAIEAAATADRLQEGICTVLGGFGWMVRMIAVDPDGGIRREARVPGTWKPVDDMLKPTPMQLLAAFRGDPGSLLSRAPVDTQTFWDRAEADLKSKKAAERQPNQPRSRSLPRLLD